ncbi:hypothetical protein FGF66_07730 [Chlorobaculum thiosulfatiphilum]|uniref:RelA/SpoT domain-containing protein n=1 Tax=Chlorobaculum thiosulfatiphilum TaxID=115852 RepID=A0A5C4S6B6_CHLTI|nr:hypothetical protein [Chlorobaculum thiosulfatiphilum]TNJ38727.1 hypothetical protein FGF66_07730 [Chlorobaculum thiosulfatiphilum]
MSVTLTEAESYVVGLKPSLDAQMTILKGKLSSISSKIYLSPGRLKTKESVYLKTKRKSKRLNEIYDYAGLRLLCLFEDDIFEVHKDFVRMLRVVDDEEIDAKYQLKKCSVYNWDKDYQESIKNEVNKYYQEGKEYKFESEEKPSGYKSIHYVVRQEGQRGWVEVQLRTLIQDVWGQLEHSISYKKGGVHPHIRKSFYLLSKDLGNIESLLSYLRTVNKKEEAGEEYFNKSAKPQYVFNYEDSIFPIIFNSKEELKNASDSYWEMVNGELLITPEWVSKARGYLDVIEDGISARELAKNQELTYWIKMEKAFLLFCEEKHEKSLEIYGDVEKEHKDRYCVYFRMGELYFILGRIVEALDAFDKAESLLKTTDGLGLVNQHRIKTKLAYTYWRLGEEYIDICNEEIDDAREKYYENPDDFTEKQRMALVNNVCWYRLEKYIILQNRFLCERKAEDEKKALKAYEDVTAEFEEVEKCLQDGGKEAGHMLDTAAWYCYWSYKRDIRNKDFLAKAKVYAYALNDMTKSPPREMRSMKTYMAHIQEIMSE